MYPENPEGTQVIVGSMNMGHIYDTARNWTQNLFRLKREPIPQGHSDGLFQLILYSREIFDGDKKQNGAHYRSLGSAILQLMWDWELVSDFDLEGRVVERILDPVIHSSCFLYVLYLDEDSIGP